MCSLAATDPDFGPSEGHRSLHFFELVASWNDHGSSIIRTQIWDILYHNDDLKNYLKVAKQPITLGELFRNNDLVELLNNLEPGIKIPYSQFRNAVARELIRNPEGDRLLLAYCRAILSAYDAYLSNVIQFLAFDLYVNIMHNYFQPTADIYVMGFFNEDDAEYEQGMKEYLDPTNLARLKMQWLIYKRRAEASTLVWTATKYERMTSAAVNETARIVALLEEQDSGIAQGRPPWDLV